MSYQLNLKGSINIGGSLPQALWHDGSHLYVSCNAGSGNEIFKLSFDGVNFTTVASVASANNATETSGDGSYLYNVNSSSISIEARNLTTLALISSYSSFTGGQVRSITCSPDGHIYAVTGGTGIGTLYAFTFDGLNLILRGSISIPGGTNAYGQRIITDGTYMYVLRYATSPSTVSNILVYSFEGDTFTLISTSPDLISATNQYPISICTDGQYFYLSYGTLANPDLRSLSYDGTWNEVQTGNLLAADTYTIVTDGQYLFTMEYHNRLGIYSHSPSSGFSYFVQYLDPSIGVGAYTNQIAISGGYVFFISGSYIKAIRLDLAATFTVDVLSGNISIPRNFTAT